MWKLTCTHESVSTGIRPCSKEWQNIISSNINDLLYCLWQEDLSKCTGISRVSPDVCTCSNRNNCRLPKSVYFYKSNDLIDGFSKGLLLSLASQFVLLSPLIDSDGNRVGLLVLDYCWEDIDQTKIVSFAETLCKTASKISFELRKKD
jgi:hypothetical protein